MTDLLYITTDAMTARTFLARTGQLRFLVDAGYDCAVACGGDAESVAAELSDQGVDVPVEPVAIAREIRPFADARSLVALVRLLRRVRPTIVNASTPKAGLLGMIAAAVCRVPVRVYLLRGLRHETTGGLKRRILMLCEWIASACATQVISVSPSLQDVYLSQRLCPPNKIRVLGGGSSNGVNVDRFDLADERAVVRKQVRGDAGIPDDAFTLGFVGRLTVDKGIADLLDAFEAIPSTPDRPLHLLLVGDYEDGDALDRSLRDRIERHPRIHRTGFVAATERYYAAMDLFVFPSYREGFPNAPLEAAAAGLATVGFDATGTRDAVVDGETGTLVRPHNAAGLSEAIETLVADDLKRTRYERAGVARVRESFRPQTIFALWRIEYARLLNRAGHAVPQRGDGQSVRRAA